MAELVISQQFKQFMNFAADAINHGDTKAIARQGAAGANGVMTITSTTDDRVCAIRRSQVNKTANDETRALFKKAVADMFGGEARIPKSVLDAMNMKDFDKGKPLTARRILAVRDAVVSEKARMHYASIMLDSGLRRTNVNLTDEQKGLAMKVMTKHADKLWNSNVNAKHLFVDKFIDVVTDPVLSKHADAMYLLIPKDLDGLEGLTRDGLHDLAREYGLK